MDSNVTSPVTKVVTLWGLIGITSWADFSYFMAGMYTCVLLGEWLWKKIIRPFAVYKGWLKDNESRPA